MDTPLDQIQQWFLSQKISHQGDMAALVGHFLDEADAFAVDQTECITEFVQQLDSDELKPNAIVQKTLYMIKLIDFTLSGRSTVQDWTETLDRLLYMKNAFTEKGDPHAVDQMLDNFHTNKEGWIGVAKSWAVLTEGNLSNKKIANWYFSHMAAEMKP